MFLYTLLFAVAVASAAFVGVHYGPAVYNSKLGERIGIANCLIAFAEILWFVGHLHQTTWIFLAVTQLAVMMCCYGAAETENPKSVRTACLWCACVPMLLWTLFSGIVSCFA